jgi:hypothetical protein
MKKIVLISILLIGLRFTSFAGLNIGAGTMYTIHEKFWKPYYYKGGFSYDFSLSYRMNQWDPGVEMFNNMVVEGEYSSYVDNHYQLFLRYYPFKSKGYSIKGGVFYSYEDRLTMIKDFSSGAIEYVYEDGSWGGYCLALGYRDRLIKKFNLYFDFEISYNAYAKQFIDNYFWRFDLGDPFYGAKVGLVCEFNLSKKNHGN